MVKQGIRALQEELRRLEDELENGGTVDAPADPELEELLEQAVLEGALPPKTDEEIAVLETVLEGEALPACVYDALKRRWERHFASSKSGVKSGVVRMQPRLALAFRKSDSKSDREDHGRTHAAIERFRRHLLGEEDYTDE